MGGCRIGARMPPCFGRDSCEWAIVTEPQFVKDCEAVGFPHFSGNGIGKLCECCHRIWAVVEEVARRLLWVLVASVAFARCDELEAFE